MKANNIKIQYPENIQNMEVVITLLKNKQNLQEISKAKEIIKNGKEVEVSFKQHRKKRSLDANGYCWVLCQRIAEVIGNTKEFVYKEAIKQVGQFEIVPIRDDAVDRWILAWNSKGIGWLSEVLTESKLEGYTNIINYYGSSIYDSREMSVLIEEIVTQAKELDIETISEEEKQSLLDSWGV